MRKTILKCSITLAALATVCFAGAAWAENILVAEFDYGPTAYTQMAADLTVAGKTVDVVDMRTGGTLASTLASKSYSQVYLYDLTGTRYLSNSDISSLASFWSGHKGLVVDTRSYGYYFQGTNPSEIALIKNVETNLALSGGGVWVGTDHNPDWTNNANPFLTAIGVNTVTGIYSDPVNFADPSSVLLAGVTPTDLWGGGATVGKAPIGVQPNGIEMFIHFGHTNADGSILPYISASFPLEGPPPISAVPEPSTLLLLGAGLIGAGILRRRVKG